MIEERNFEYKGKTFVLSLSGTLTGFSVVASVNGQQVSPSYSVDFETHADYFMRYKQSLTENLFGIAQSDIEHEIYFRE